MERRSQHDPPDPSDFFRLNEEVARELARLEGAGQLDRLLELLGSAGSELWVTAARRADGLEEALGVLRPRQADAAPTVPLGAAPAEDAGGGCCGPPDPDHVEAVRGIATARQTQAARLASAGRFAEAEQVLEAAVTQLIELGADVTPVRAMLEDLRARNP